MKISHTLPLLALALAPVLAQASDMPPAGSLPASTIASQLEKQGYTPIMELSFDDGRWEVDAMKGNTKHELTVDAKDGKVLTDRVDDWGAKRHQGH